MEQRKLNSLISSFLSFLEEVKKNVEYRVPPPKDKRSLQFRYETLSMKRMKDILRQTKEDKRPRTSGSERDVRLELEAELKNLRDAVEKGEDTLELHTRRDGKASLGGKLLPAGLALDAITSLPVSGRSSGADTHEESQQLGWDMEYYLDHLDTDSLYEIGKAASPYRRSTKQLKEMSRRRQLATKRGGSAGTRRPRSAHATSKSVDLTREELTLNGGDNEPSREALGCSYQDLHGTAGHARHMAPSPVKNPSLRFLAQQRERKEAADRVLYETVLQEARLMQQKFTSCVKEANYFSRKLNKGDLYKVTERDPAEEAQWSSLLALKGQPPKSSQIPKGSGQRIAKAQVEVHSQHKGVRYLGTDHFFREHGRLQHEFQRYRSVNPVEEEEGEGSPAKADIAQKFASDGPQAKNKNNNSNSSNSNSYMSSISISSSIRQHH